MLAFYTVIDNEADRDKFDRIYEKYKRLVYCIAYKKLQDRHLAEDVTQETFFRIAENMHMFEEVHSSKTKNLVARIALGKAIDLIRSRKNIFIMEEKDNMWMNVESESSPLLDDLICKETYGELRLAISKLEEKDKTILQLRYTYEYSIQEISGLMGISYKAATNRIYRAKDRLATLLLEMQKGNREAQ